MYLRKKRKYIAITGTKFTGTIKSFHNYLGIVLHTRTSNASYPQSAGVSSVTAVPYPALSRLSPFFFSNKHG